MRHTSNGIRCDKRTDLGMPTTLHSTLCRSHSSWMALAAALPPDRQSMLCFFLQHRFLTGIHGRRSKVPNGSQGQLVSH